MNPLHRVSSWTAVALLIGGVTVVLGVGLLCQARRIPGALHPGPFMGERSFTIARPTALDTNVDWSLLVGHASDAREEDDLIKRYRLAGTYFEISVGMAEEPRAIIDDLRQREQRIVRRGDQLTAGILVKQIARDAVTLLQNGRETVLRLNAGFGAESVEPVAGVTENGGQGALLAKFGAVQPFTNRWRFDRARLLTYYDELRDQPERLLAIFDSFDPLYDENQQISGYIVGIEGEADFFAAAGLQNGDVVRAVNSVPMTSRRRAEFFIRRFVEQGAEAFVMEVERDGKIEKQVYVIPKE